MASRSGRNTERESNIRPRRRRIDRPAPDRARFRVETAEYFKRRLERLEIVETTRTPSGQTLDWIAIESQHPRAEIASPPPEPEIRLERLLGRGKQREQLAGFELQDPGVERGPAGTVPVLRKNLRGIGYNQSLRHYLSKTRGHRMVSGHGIDLALPEEDGQHRYASSSESITCFGGEGALSCFDPYLESPDDFSLIQIGLSNSDLGYKQTVEAGWQEFKNLTGDWVPHLFVFYTTNGYTDDGDNKGGYNTDVDGWVQYDDSIYPGATFTPYSDRGGSQRMIAIKYQLWQGNWWFRCQGRWLGYYPASLFMGNQSVFSTLGDHADRIGFWGEIFDSDDVSGRTASDMGSGYWPESGWTWSAYMHNLRVQTDRGGGTAEYDGSAGVWRSDPDMYDVEPHFNSGSSWGSYMYLGGPGAG